MSKKQILPMCLFFMMLGGCAINDKGFVKVAHYENKTSYVTTLESWGGYLSTRHADRGLILGYTKRTIVYPKLENESPSLASEWLSQFEKNKFKKIEGSKINLKYTQPYMLIENNQGVMFYANPQRIGFSTGIIMRDTLRVPKQFNGILIMNKDKNGGIKSLIQSNKIIRNNKKEKI